MNILHKKIEIKSLVISAFIGAAIILSIAAATRPGSGCCSPRLATPTALEYRVYKYGRLPTHDHIDDLQKKMNELASEGWTITQVITNPEDDNRCTLVMSRPKR
jgi:hypothetical protein